MASAAISLVTGMLWLPTCPSQKLQPLPLTVSRMTSAGRPLTARALAARAEAWRPWRGYAVFHLWGAAAASPGRTLRRQTGE